MSEERGCVIGDMGEWEWDHLTCEHGQEPWYRIELQNSKSKPYLHVNVYTYFVNVGAIMHQSVVAH